MRLSRSLFTIFLLQFFLGTILFKDILRSLLLSVMNLGFNLMMTLNETGVRKTSKNWIFIIFSTFISIGFGKKYPNGTKRLYLSAIFLLWCRYLVKKSKFFTESSIKAIIEASIYRITYIMRSSTYRSSLLLICGLQIAYPACIPPYPLEYAAKLLHASQ